MLNEQLFKVLFLLAIQRVASCLIYCMLFRLGSESTTSQFLVGFSPRLITILSQCFININESVVIVPLRGQEVLSSPL